MSNEANTDPEEPVDDELEQTEPESDVDSDSDSDSDPEPEPEPNRPENAKRPNVSAPGKNGRPIEAAIVDAKHDAEALELRRAFCSYREIARIQGCSVSTAFERVERALSAYVPRESVDTYRRIASERLEQAASAAAELAANPDATIDQRLAAIGSYVRTEDRLAKLLGADTPVEQRVRVRKVDDLDARIEDLLEQMRSRESAS